MRWPTTQNGVAFVTRQNGDLVGTKWKTPFLLDLEAHHGHVGPAYVIPDVIIFLKKNLLLACICLIASGPTFHTQKLSIEEIQFIIKALFFSQMISQNCVHTEVMKHMHTLISRELLNSWISGVIYHKKNPSFISFFWVNFHSLTRFAWSILMSRGILSSTDEPSLTLHDSVNVVNVRLLLLFNDNSLLLLHGLHCLSCSHLTRVS